MEELNVSWNDCPASASETSRNGMGKAMRGWVTLACRPGINDCPRTWSLVIPNELCQALAALLFNLLHDAALRPCTGCLQKGQRRGEWANPICPQRQSIRGHLSSAGPLHNGDIHPALFYVCLAERRVTQTLLKKPEFPPMSFLKKTTTLIFFRSSGAIPLLHALGALPD